MRIHAAQELTTLIHRGAHERQWNMLCGRIKQHLSYYEYASRATDNRDPPLCTRAPVGTRCASETHVFLNLRERRTLVRQRRKLPLNSYECLLHRGALWHQRQTTACQRAQLPSMRAVRQQVQREAQNNPLPSLLSPHHKNTL